MSAAQFRWGYKAFVGRTPLEENVMIVFPLDIERQAQLPFHIPGKNKHNCRLTVI